jgi:hypothetical protein
MSTRSEIVPLRTLAKRLPKLNYLKNDRQNLRQLDPENGAKARLKLAVVFCFLRRQGRCRRAQTRMRYLSKTARNPDHLLRCRLACIGSCSVESRRNR